MSRPASAKFLYRIIRFERLVQMLKTDEWHFAHPSTWEDPYEIRIKNSLSPALFAQCWCRNGVSDAMWRIYSQDKLGVRIRTNTDRLRAALHTVSRERDIGFRVARVKYVNELQYIALTGKNALDLARRVTFVRASAHLYFKRLAFEHEAETRVVALDLLQPQDAQPRGLRIKLDSRNLIESVLVDPRAPDEYVEAYRHYLKETLNFPGTVRKSSLYRSNEARET